MKEGTAIEQCLSRGDAFIFLVTCSQNMLMFQGQGEGASEIHQLYAVQPSTRYLTSLSLKRFFCKREVKILHIDTMRSIENEVIHEPLTFTECLAPIKWSTDPTLINKEEEEGKKQDAAEHSCRW